jgi:thiamine-phosphate diphosphorylase/hydroxyethylthiazole kinase
VAAEIAVESGNVRGPGTFLGALVDVLWTLTPEDVIKRARFSVHDV